MKKKAIIISLCSVVFVAWIFGVVYTNVRAQRPVVKTYSMNEAVPYESDYFRRSDNILKGYTVTVLSSEILPYDEYAEKYNIDLPETGTDEFGNPIYRPEYVYDVEAKFVNTDNVDGGVDMFDTLLETVTPLCFARMRICGIKCTRSLQARILSVCTRIPKWCFTFLLPLNLFTANGILLKR